MIKEDESLSTEENQSLVSNVTWAAFVLTPVGRKLHGHSDSDGVAPTNSHDGHASLPSHGRPHHAPRDGATPGSALHAKPSKSKLLQWPSLAM
jgi:hypothetical protein